MQIIRDQTPDEVKDFVPISTPKQTVFREEDKFRKRMLEEIRKVNERNRKLPFEERIPFAEQVAMTELKDVQEEITRKFKQTGFVDEELKKILNKKIDWSRYSDKKNFEFIKETERDDGNLSRKNPGILVTQKFRKFRFKGFQFTNTIAEDSREAVKRARDSTTPMVVRIEESKK